MKKFVSLGAATLVASMLAMPVLAQTSQGTDPAHTAHMTRGELRSSKLIGMSVYNDQGQDIGTIDEVLINPSGGPPSAVLSVGKFLGTGNKLVLVSLDHLKLEGGKGMMAGASKERLASMPIFSYGPNAFAGNG